MITPVKALTIMEMVKRENDLVVSIEDIKQIARNERNNAIEDAKKLVTSMGLSNVSSNDVNIVDALESLKEDK